MGGREEGVAAVISGAHEDGNPRASKRSPGPGKQPTHAHGKAKGGPGHERHTGRQQGLFRGDNVGARISSAHEANFALLRGEMRDTLRRPRVQNP